MKVLHVNTLDFGGAAISARRLHDGLVALGHDSRMLIQQRGADALRERTTVLDPERYPSIGDPLLDTFFDTVYRTRREPDVDVLFSTDRPDRDLTTSLEVRAAQIINLHWTAWMVSAPAVAALQTLGTPIVWTLHDQFPFTGGCHYSGACTQYESDCGDCGLVRPEVRLLPRLVLARKRHWLDAAGLTVVAPSTWLADCAKRSALFRDADVRVIPYGLPVSDFQMMDRETARGMLGLPPDASILLFGADSVGERRKGYAHLMDALRLLSTDPDVADRIANRPIVCATFGNGHPADVPGGIPVRNLGALSGERLIAAYRAADAFILPTLEDNLPNTMLEAVAAGTPVVGYETGGVPDVLREAGCGLVAERGNVGALATSIVTLLLDDAMRNRLRATCEAYARSRLTLNVQAGAYARLYEELLTTRTARRARGRQLSEIVSEDERTLARVLQRPKLTTAPFAAFREELAIHQAAITVEAGHDNALRGGDDATGLARTRAELGSLERRIAELEQMGRALECGSLRIRDEEKLHDAAGPLEWLLRTRMTPTVAIEPSAVRHGLVSVIVPSCNMSRYLEQAIRSVWAQTVDPDRIELLVADDGSTDGSYELACSMRASSPIGMSVLTHPDRANKGVSATRNLALANARGEFIAPLDADDVFLPARVATGLDYMAAHPDCRALCSLGDYIDAEGRHVPGPGGSDVAGDYRALSSDLRPPFTFEQLWTLYPVVNSSLLARREAIDTCGGYAEDLAQQAEDRLLVLQLSLQAPVHCLEERLILYRHHPGNYTSQYVAHGFEDAVRLELLYHLVHWMVVREPRWRDRGLALLRANHPRLSARAMHLSQARAELVERICAESGLDAEAYLSERRREAAELSVLRQAVPAALRDARDARAEVERLQGELSRLRKTTLCA